MTVRTQIYEYTNEGRAIPARTRQSIFLPEIGKPISALATHPCASAIEFLVLENMGATPNIGECYLQIQIGTTSLFLNPDGMLSEGVPASLMPYPKVTERFRYCVKLIPVYVLPGQKWNVILYNKKEIKEGEEIKAFVEYTLYDGPDTIIACRLLEIGKEINPQNINEYKNNLIGDHDRKKILKKLE